MKLTNSNAGFTNSITFDATVFAAATTISFTAGLRTISESVIITGPAAGVTLDANNTDQRFTITAGKSVSVSDMSFTKFSSINAGAVFGSASSVTLSVTNAKFTNNKSTATGGALGFTLGGTSLTLTNSTFSGNSSGSSGGAVYMNSSTLSFMTVTGSTFTSNTATSGGALRAGANLTLSNSSFTGNTSTGATGGGAIYISATPTATISNSRFTNNLANTGTGGAIRTNGATTINFSEFVGNTASLTGGAGHASGAMTVNNSTFFGNTAGTTGGALNLASSSATVINQSTFNRNTASGTAGGGAIGHASTGAMTINNSTIFNNTATGSSTAANGGGIVRTSTGTVTISSSIVAGNSVTGTGSRGKDIYSTTAATTVGGSNNIIGTNTNSTSTGSITFSGASNQIGEDTAKIDAKLGSLEDNGGEFVLPGGGHVLTMGLQPGSPAIDAGADNGFANDQRGSGFPRVLNGGIALQADIGAYEGTVTTPQATLTSAPDVVAAGNGAQSIAITYTGSNGIDSTTFDVNDITVTGQGFGGGQKATSISIDNTGAPNTYVVTYTVPAPVGGWGGANIGSYTVALNASQVADLSAQNVKAGTLGTFKTAFATTLVVDLASDVDDGNYAVGQLTLREALKIANNNAGFSDTINFAGNVTGTINVTNGQMAITDPVAVNGPGAAKLTLNGAGNNNRAFNIDLVTGGGAVAMSGLTVSSFSTTLDGGALFIQDAAVTLNDMVLTGNSAALDGGAINLKAALATLNMSNSVVDNNKAATEGGAINMEVATTVTINTSSIHSNTSAADGGGINNESTGTLNITSSSIRNNTASGTSADGGGIMFGGSGVLVVENSTISGNRSNSTGGTGQGGGGMYLNTATTATFTNTTISNNSTSASGGAIHIDDTAVINFRNSTMFGNSAGSNGGGVNLRLTGGTFNAYSSIIAGNTAVGSGADIFGVSGSTVNVEASNIGVSAGITTLNQTGANLIDVDPMLDPLGNNGGFVLPDGTTIETNAIKSGSPVIDAGANSIGLTFDQRGTPFSRVENGGTALQVDMGAYERKVAVVPPPTVTNVTFGDGTNQRSLVKQIVVTFSEPVTFLNNVADAFTLTRTGTGGPVGNVTLTANPVTGPASSVTITFSGSLSEFGSLVDGFYDFTISAAEVSGAGGALDGNGDNIPGGSYAVTGDTVNKFFRLFGDGNGSGVTDLGDFAAFRSVFNLGPNTTFDFDNDGNVGLSDFAAFRARFNLTP